jgi:hypothetical protein
MKYISLLIMSGLIFLSTPLYAGGDSSGGGGVANHFMIIPAHTVSNIILTNGATTNFKELDKQSDFNSIKGVVLDNGSFLDLSSQSEDIDSLCIALENHTTNIVRFIIEFIRYDQTVSTEIQTPSFVFRCIEIR